MKICNNVTGWHTDASQRKSSRDGIENWTMLNGKTKIGSIFGIVEARESMSRELRIKIGGSLPSVINFNGLSV
jgi:hypothetical protein